MISKESLLNCKDIHTFNTVLDFLYLHINFAKKHYI